MAGEQLDYGPMVQQTLGYLWDLPAPATSTRGLGGGITWRGTRYCDDLPQFREDFFFIEHLASRDLKAAKQSLLLVGAPTTAHPLRRGDDGVRAPRQGARRRGQGVEGVPARRDLGHRHRAAAAAAGRGCRAAAAGAGRAAARRHAVAVAAGAPPPRRQRVDPPRRRVQPGVGGDAAATALPAAKASYDFRTPRECPLG